MPVKLTTSLSAALAALLALGLSAACGGHAQLSSDEGSGGVLAQPPPAIEMTQFPAPSELVGGGHTVSYAGIDLIHKASELSPLLPECRADISGEALIMRPRSFPGQPESLGRLAYALYDFRLDGYDRDPVVDLDWFIGPDSTRHAYVGLANFSRDHWDWFAAPAGQPLALPSFAPYLHSGTSQMLMLIVLDGSTDGALTHVRVGGGYDEFEDSADSQLCQLPLGNFSGFSGNIGAPQGGSPAYDGDNSDVFSSVLRVGDTVHYTVTFNTATCGQLSMELSSYFAGVLSTVAGPSPLELVHTIAPGEEGLISLGLSCVSGGSDYLISCQIESAPQARISSNVWSGAAPLAVDFDASRSTDSDGSVVKYEWDFDGDGTFDLDSGSDATVSHSYPQAGTWRCVLRATDNDGRSGSAIESISVGPVEYNESEPNNSLSSLPRVPSLPFSNFRGSVGSGPGYPGYSGDDADAMQLFLTPGKKAHFRLIYDPATAPGMQVGLVDRFGVVPILATATAPGQLDVSITAGEDYCQPYTLLILTDTGTFSDYQLSGDLGQTPAAMLKSSVQAGLAPLSCSFSAAGSSDDGSIVKYEWDWDNDLNFDQDSGQVGSASHTFTVTGPHTVNVRVTDNDGLQATASRTVYAWSSVYDEIEPNETLSPHLNSLPAIPFSGFRGNVGEGGDYDGGRYDYFVINDLKAGDKFRITVTYEPSFANIQLLLLDNSIQGQLGDSATGSGTEVIEREIYGSVELPLKLQVYAASGASDYSVKIEKI